MNNQIETIMALITAAIKLYAYHATDDVMVVDDGKAINAVKEALEAALKPGEPVAWQGIHDTTDLYWRKPVQGDVRPLYDAPPAQTPKGLFVDLIAQHPGLAEELRAIDELPMPAQTLPPRLTDAELDAMNNIELEKLDYEVFEVNQQSVKDSFRAIETAVRKQWAKHLGVNDE